MSSYYDFARWDKAKSISILNRAGLQNRWGRGEIVRDWLDDLNALSIVATCLIWNHKQRPSRRMRIRLKKRAP